MFQLRLPLLVRLTQHSAAGFLCYRIGNFIVELQPNEYKLFAFEQIARTDHWQAFLDMFVVLFWTKGDSLLVFRTEQFRRLLRNRSVSLKSLVFMVLSRNKV